MKKKFDPHAQPAALMLIAVFGDADPFCFSSDSDLIIRNYVRDCCICEPGGKATGGALYSRFVTWYRDHIGANEPTGTWFGRRISQYFRKSKRNGIVTYLGITVRPAQ